MNKLMSALLLSGGIALAAPAWSNPLAEAQSRLAAGDPAAAYRLLQPLEGSRLGEPEFDYLWGLALLGNARPNEATLAFERVLARNPRHAAAHLDMARAWLALGNHERAEQSLARAEALDPPPTARAVIDQLRQTIAARRGGGLKWRAYAEAGVGRDSNVTVGPRQESVYLPYFGSDFTLGSNARSASDRYAQATLGGELRHALAGDRALTLGGDLRWRDYRTIDTYDMRSGDLRASYQANRADGSWRLTLGHNQHDLDDSRYRRVESLGGEWRQSLGARAQWSAFAQAALIRHAGETLRENDANQGMLGLSWAAGIGPRNATTVLATAFAGVEEARFARSDGDKRFAGVRVGAQHGFSEHFDLYAAAGVLDGRYQASNILFDTRRTDVQYDLSVGASWRFAPAWSLRPQLNWTHNDSNLAIHDYRRLDAGLLVRREFD